MKDRDIVFLMLGAAMIFVPQYLPQKKNAQKDNLRSRDKAIFFTRIAGIVLVAVILLSNFLL